MIFNLAAKALLGMLVAVALGGGGYYAVKTYNTHSLTRTLAERLNAGDYLAALAAAGKLKESGEQSQELDERIASAARLLVAEDALSKARKAADEKRFGDAGVLLRGSAALTDPSFKRLEEAKKLYEEVEALAASAAHKTAVTISALEEKAKSETVRRQELEQNKKKLEGALSEKEQSLSQSKAETAEARQSAESSREEADAKQAALAQEQARAKLLMEQVEKESKQRFFNELKVYRDMAQKGKLQLENAIVEISGKRDVTALIYVSQGKILFEEVKNKASDLRSNRIPTVYQPKVDDLVRAAEQFLEASKQLRNAVVYIDEQGSAEFTTGFSKGKAALANAVSLLLGVTELIAANP